MVWLLLGIIIWAALIYLVGPLLRKSAPDMNDDSEIRAYQAEIARLTREIEAGGGPELNAQKIDLQRQLLRQSESKAKDAKAPPYLAINTLFLFFVFGGLGLYAMLGRPELTKGGALETAQIVAESQTPAPEPPQAPSTSLEALLTQLKSKLDSEQKNDATGWMLYARTLMNVGRFDEAFEAYETVLPLTDNDPQVVDELARAREFAEMAAKNPAPMRGPSADDVKDAASLSPEEREDMIKGMVSGLAGRLRGNPEDPEGWKRLLRARKVLGQTEEAQADIALIRKTFGNEPQIGDQILLESGWNE